jgi:hypothetical protein
MASRHTWTNRIGALAVGIGLAMSLVIVPCWWGIFRFHDSTCSRNKPDFISFYTGAKLIWENRSSLYDLEQQRLIQQPIDPSRAHWVLPYFYPPFFAVLLSPMAWLSFSTAFALTTLINFALLILALRLLILKLELNREQTTWLCLAAFSNYGVHYAFLEGQTSFLGVFLLVCFVAAVIGSDDRRAGVSTGLMFFKPPLLLIPLWVLINQLRWRAMVTAGFVIALLLAISLLAVGWSGISDYLALSRRAMADEEILHIEAERMHNLRALFYFFTAAPWRDYLWWGATLIVLILVAIRCRTVDQAVKNSNGPWIAIFVSMIVATPHLHDHDLTFLLIPWAFALKLAGPTVPSKLAIALVLLGIIPLINTMAYPYLPPLIPLIGLIYLVGDFARWLFWRPELVK